MILRDVANGEAVFIDANIFFYAFRPRSRGC